MGTKINNFQNNAKNSNIILTSESNEMEFSKEIETVSSFKNSDFVELKIIVIDHEPYFIGSPIASFLGYTNPRKAIRDHVDEDDRMIMKVPDTQGWNETFLPYTPNTKILIINESGLYSLIFGSKMDFAKKFKKWVTSEVLPSIRKTGSYSITPKDYPSALRALADEIDAKNRAIAERAQAEAERQQAIKTIEEQRPDVEFAESFKKVDHENMWLIRDVAKKLEQNGIIIAEKNLRLFLEEVKFMFRNGQGRWELYSDIVKNKFGVYRSYFVDKYSGERVNQQTIYMTGAGYEATLKGIKEKCRSLFLKYGKFEDPNF
jgi:anti-repressor protein